ncbi:MAG TPA: hypothetical protein VMF06_24865, partial [Candidatus Limnocylindria bacterium]|nr:hypothetical protein [Candidatus Limnocylindria bacterium]
GNVFNGPVSKIGGNADFLNNVENIIIAPGYSGEFTVKVTASNVVAPGVPNPDNGPRQDFALVIYNAVLGAPVIESITVDDGVPTVTFRTGSGIVYSLEYKNDLGDAEWLALPGEKTGNGDIQALTDPTAASATRFYRIQAR